MVVLYVQFWLTVQSHPVRIGRRREQVAAKTQLDQLRAAADAQDRNRLEASLLEQLVFEGIAFTIRGKAGRVKWIAVSVGTNVAAAA